MISVGKIISLRVVIKSRNDEENLRRKQTHQTVRGEFTCWHLEES